MDGITLSFTDARPVLAPGALEEQVRAAAPLLAEAAAGEERYRDNLGWHSVDEAAGPERVDFLLEQAARVRADADAFVVIGIGGSNQASRAAIKALRPEGGPAILWAGNTISACEMARTLRELDGYQSIYIDCIAKNFETLEPGIAFRVLRQYLERRYGAEGAAKRIFATGTPGSTLHQLCLDQGYTFLTFPETIGGRYSVGSDVGLFPMAVAGVDIRALVQGMRDMRDTLLAAPAEENPALRYACLRYTAVGARLPPGDALLFRTPAGLLRQVVDSALRRERGQGGHRPLPGGGLQLGGSPLHRPVHPGGQSHPFRDLRGGARPRRVGAPAPRGQEGLLRLPDGQGLLGHQQHRPPGHHAGPQRPGHPLHEPLHPRNRRPHPGRAVLFLPLCLLSLLQAAGRQPLQPAGRGGLQGLYVSKFGKAGCQLNETHFFESQAF
ncbi:MAG: hypothetical protein ACLRNQ_19360 [Flavonifractor plautii]